jgi:putative hemolysin
MDIAILAALILLNGVFAMSEIALLTARRNRLERLAAEGDKSAAVAMRLGEEPTQFLSTVQVGITAIGILNGIVGEAALAGPFSEFLQQLGLDAQTSGVGATAIVVATITYLTIVIGELVPKRLAQLNAEGVARRVARPVAVLAQLSRPFVFLLSVSTDGILRLLGRSEAGTSAVTEEDIDALLVEGSEAGVIEAQEHEMVRNVLRLDDFQVPSLMTPRSEIVFVDVERPLDERMATIIESDHSRFPVCRGGMHDVLGVITAKRLLRRQLEGGVGDSAFEDLGAAIYVPESLTGMQLLEQFRESGVQMVFVVDEYGQIIGLITVQDLLEALAGEFKPHGAADGWATQRADGSWLLDGLMPIHAFKDRLELATLPDEDRGRYQTLSGMMMWLIGKVPRTGDSAEWAGWRLEVVDLDGNRIDKVLAVRLPEPEPAPEGDADAGAGGSEA